MVSSSILAVVATVLVASAVVSARPAIDLKPKPYVLNRESLMWEEFKAKFNKVYATEEEHSTRRQAFLQNMRKAEWMNGFEVDSPFGTTKFSDLTEEEFRNTYLMNPNTLNKLITERRAHARVADLSAYDNVALPISFDWRDKQGVTKVKNQGQCGSCWAFSTTENVESVWHIEGGNTMTELSVSQIVDCDGKDDGCGGGDLPTAFNYVLKNGLEAEESYPYSPSDGRCDYDASKVVARIDGWEYASKNRNETEMQVYVYNKAPISICVDAMSWQMYSGGILTRNCGKQLDHCVQIVGFNSAHKNGRLVPYWIVRNSWGEDWGEDGFIYIERNEDLCGIGKEPASSYIHN